MPRKPTKKQLLAAEGVVQGKSLHKAYLDAGYAPTSAKTLPYDPLENSRIRELIAERTKRAQTKASIHTDVITGWLVEMATSTMDDCIDEQGRFSLKKSRQTGAIHCIRKVEKTAKGYKIEMYSRLDAASQLRDNFGMKQEPRANTFEETRRLEVEKEIDKIMVAEECDRPSAAKMLREALGTDSPLIPTVNKYVN